jgi:3-hydroxyacyl-CoA dehydrogenase/enoyl-CoA hydratase/3-hydroxybutyryl-CoA epimerase
VNGDLGSFASRVLTRFLVEAIAMVAEGINAVSVEQAGLQAGYSSAPLELCDAITLTRVRGLRESAKAATGADWEAHGSEAIIDRLVSELGRDGRSAGAGFYDYADGNPVRLWPGLFEYFAVGGRAIPLAEMQERMLFAQSLESIRCLDDGVLCSVAEANVGSLEIGFPAWTGGVIQYINCYEGGLRAFVQRAQDLADGYGPRFLPPPSLVALANAGEAFA